MSQYDAAANTTWRCFEKVANPAGFNAKPLQWDINEKNTRSSAMQRKSELFNFKKEDSINDHDFTEVLWKGIKGEDAIVPAPKRAAFLKLNAGKDLDD
jgi:hypothetical protein